MQTHFFFIDGPNGREYFTDSQIKEANARAQVIANITGKPATRRDQTGGQSCFYPELLPATKTRLLYGKRIK